MKTLSKRIRFAGLLLSFLTQSLIYDLWAPLIGVPIRERFRKRAQRLSQASRRALKILGVQVQLHSTHARASEYEAGLVVANHISTLDVLAISAFHPALFVTSTEVRGQSGVGFLCRSAGCLFVNRRNRSQLKNEIQTIQNTLELGTSVVIFPEATSSDGTRVLPFRSSLFQTAIDAQVPVYCYSVWYSDPRVAYHGDMEFLPHLLEITQMDHIGMTLQYLGAQRPSSELLRFSLAQSCHEKIQDAHPSR